MTICFGLLAKSTTKFIRIQGYLIASSHLMLDKLLHSQSQTA